MRLAQDPGVENQGGRRLLVVDDEVAIAFALGEYFQLLGYRVDCAHERAEAEALVACRRYEVVIADLRLSWLDHCGGLELLADIHQRQPNARLVVLTAYGSAELRAEAGRRGIHAFLDKPRPLAAIAQVVEGLLPPPPADGTVSPS
jgi:DNA-binding NtrC family response regulator